jgi:hypothetical protein
MMQVSEGDRGLTQLQREAGFRQVARLAERELTMFRRGMAFRSTSQGLAAPLSNPAEVLLLHRHMLWKQKRSRLTMAESCQVLSVSSRQAMSR